MIDRILKIIEIKKINKNQFYKKTGLSNGFLDKVKDVGASKLEHILKSFPDISPEWLLTGKGEMLKEPAQPIISSSQPQENDNEVIALLKENNAILKDQLRDKEEKEALYKEKIKRLEREITNLEKDLQQHKKTAQPTVSDILHQPTR